MIVKARAIFTAFVYRTSLAVLALAMSACSTEPAKVELAVATPTPPHTQVAVDLPIDPIVMTPIVWSPLTSHVTPVKGTDGKIHLAYEVLLTNMTKEAVQISSIEVVDPARDNQVFGVNRVLSMKDEDVTGMPRLFGRGATFAKGDYTRELPALESGVVYIDVTVPEGSAIPARLKHRITMLSGRAGSTPVKGVSGIVDVAEKPPIVMGPLFKGDGWLNGNGCCAAIGPHRYTMLPSNGALRDAERYAIDFIKLDKDGRASIGDVAKLENWPYYKTELLAGAAGTVVNAVDGLKDEKPGADPADVTAATAAGNHVIIDFGEGRFAMYAHLAPGSLKVKAGDRVTRGQVIGLLGNSGNSDAPHLHFQIMDRPSPLDAMGLPFVFEEMEYQGRAIGTLDEIGNGASKGIQVRIAAEGAGTRRLQLPLSLDVIGFK